MPLSKKRDRERKRAIAKARLDSNLEIPPTFQPSRPPERATEGLSGHSLYDSTPRPGREPDREKLAALRELMTLARPKQGASVPNAVPLYNPAVHRAGDRVRVLQHGRMIETVIPNLDVDGQPIPWDD